jgi:misacylated tRNA(Ala) deacylase
LTALLFRDDPSLRSAEAVVQSADEAGIVLDRTVFYAQGGGQPGDTGWLRTAEGLALAVVDTLYAPDKATVLHRLAPDAQGRLNAGDRVTAELDWPRRHARMRIHTALHLLTTVLPYPVTGGSIGDGEGRLDFDMPETGDRATIEEKLNRVIAENHPVSAAWITDEELAANPGLVKTMSVKPPMGTGRVRLVRIGEIDLQPCGGTHVASTAEIGPIEVTGIEKKGKQNRRVRIALATR